MINKASVVVSLLGLAIASDPCWAEQDTTSRDLRDISFFGSIAVSVHVANAGDTARPELSSNQLTQYAKRRFAESFADISFRNTDESRWARPENVRAMGRLSCRVWVDAGLLPAAYQVKCQISTIARPNIIDDGSIGYAPAGSIDATVRQQIDRMLSGFAAVFVEARAAP